MTELDVLIIESHPGAARHEVADLEAAGHRVHRCYDPGADGFPCVAITDPDACPVDRGVDVALISRRRVTPRPTSLEQGVSCALRAGIPVVQDGPTVLDPYEGFVTGRVHGDAVGAIEDAVTGDGRRLQKEIVNRASGVLAAAGLDADGLTCSFERVGDRLRVRFEGTEVPQALAHAVAVRALDAIRAHGRRFAQVDLTWATPTAG